MQYRNVCLEGIAYALPEEVVTSDQIEARLEPLYRRLRLPEGRLELMTGIRQRRFWPPGMLPSEKSVETAERAISAAGLDKGDVGVLIHGSVCRDSIEPATACTVHHRLDLAPNCMAFDVSNACLGLLSGMLLVANMIELGQIRAGVVVGTEDSRSLVETTIARLNRDISLTRNDVKLALASLTIGSASAAVVLVDRKLSRTGNRLLGGVARAQTDQYRLCQGNVEGVGQQVGPLMWTDSEALMHQGVQAAGPLLLSSLPRSAGILKRSTRPSAIKSARPSKLLLLPTLGIDQDNRLFDAGVPRQHRLRGPADHRRHGHRKWPPAPQRSGGDARHRLRYQRANVGSRLAAQSSRRIPHFRRRSSPATRRRALTRLPVAKACTLAASVAGNATTHPPLRRLRKGSGSRLVGIISPP